MRRAENVGETWEADRGRSNGRRCAARTRRPAAAAPDPGGYQQNDGRGFWNILPPGSNGLSNGPELLAFLSTGTRPAHNDDQLDLYANLIRQSPGLGPGEIPTVFKDASFGVRPANVERTYSPASRCHDRSRPLRRPAHLRLHPRGDDVRRRLRVCRGPPLLHGRAAQRRPRPALILRRRRQRRHGPRRLGLEPLHRGRPPAPDRVFAAELPGGGRPAARRFRRLCRRDQRLHRPGPAEPGADARRVCGDRPPAGTRRLHRPRSCRQRGADRRDLRQGRRPRAPFRRRPPGGDREVRPSRRPPRLARLPQRRGPRGPDDGAGPALRLPATAPEPGRRPARRRNPRLP